MPAASKLPAFVPVPLAFPLGLLLGLSLAWLARGELARSDVPLVLARPFLVTCSLGLFVMTPVVGYFAALHADWAWLYLVRDNRMPSAVALAAAILAGAMLPIGFAVAAPWAIGRQGVRIAQVAAGLGAVLLLFALLCSKRLSVSATYTQFHGGFGMVAIGKSPLGRGVVASWVALCAAYAVSAWGLRRPRSRS